MSNQMFFPIDPIIGEMKIKNALHNRKVCLFEEVDRDTMFKVVYLMDRLVDRDEKNGIPMGQREPIEISISTCGGGIYDGLVLVSKIEELKRMGYTIITTVEGYAMSMGFMFLICGSVRKAQAHSRIMVHQPSSGSYYATMREKEESLEELMDIWVKIKTLILKYTKMTDAQLEDIKYRKVDKYMWAEEALELGVIDEII